MGTATTLRERPYQMVLPDFIWKGAVPQSMLDMVRSMGTAANQAGVPSTEVDPRLRESLLDRWGRDIRAQGQQNEQGVANRFARMGMGGSGQQEKAMQQTQWNTMQGLGEANQSAFILGLENAQRELELKNQQYMNAYSMMKDVTSGTPPGYWNPYQVTGPQKSGGLLGGLGSLLPMATSMFLPGIGQGIGALGSMLGGSTALGGGLRTFASYLTPLSAGI